MKDSFFKKILYHKLKNKISIRINIQQLDSKQKNNIKLL